MKIMPTTRILIVEDESSLAMDMRQQLAGLGYAVSSVAATGEEAIAHAKATRPDLVLMDIVLKGPMDGVQAAEHIRAHLGIPVVYMMANADPATVKRMNLTGL